MLLVLHLDAGAAAGQVLEAAGLQTDQVELLILVRTGFGAAEVVYSLDGSLHDDYK